MADNLRPNGFRTVDAPAAYIRAQGLPLRRFVKRAAVSARPGSPGERVVTTLADGFRETENTVGVDPRTGAPDWVITAPSGERYIVRNAAFRERYIPDPDASGRYIPAGKPVLAAQVPEDLCIRAPWGELQAIRAGGWLIVAGEGDVYGNSEDEFLSAYVPLNDAER